MQRIATGFARSAARPSWVGDMRRALRILLDALDRLVPPTRDAPRGRELSAEWFKYPPV